MSFYMSTNGQLHPYHFTYLDNCVKKVRLEKTEIHSETKKRPGPKREDTPDTQKNYFAIDVMTSDLVTEVPDSAIKLVKEKMKNLGAHHVPIVQNFKLVGLISDRDLLKTEHTSTFYFLKATDIMTTVLVVCDEDTPIEWLAKVLLEEKISCLPVVDKNQRLTGIITRSDMLRFIIENQLVLK